MKPLIILLTFLTYLAPLISFSQQRIYFNPFFQSRANKKTELVRKYTIENSAVITEDYKSNKIQFSSKIHGTTDLIVVDDFLHYVRQLGSQAKYKDSFKDLNGEFRFYYSDGKPSEALIFKRNKLLYTQAWNDEGTEQLRLGTGINKEISDEDHCEIFQEYKDSLMAKYYQVRNMMKDTIYVVVDKQAEPKEGMQTFYEQITKILTYPTIARFLGKEGKVFITFIVDETGKLDEFVPKTKEGYRFEKKVIQKLQRLPNWKPAIFRGRAVKTRFALPVNYKLID